MKSSSKDKSDMHDLRKLNTQFIENFIKQDVTTHERIIDEDFICIENSGAIVKRNVI